MFSKLVSYFSRMCVVIVIAIASTGLVLLLSSCSESEQQVDSQTGQGLTWSVSTSNEVETRSVWETIADLYNSRNEHGNEVELDFITDDPNALRTLITTNLAGGTASDIQFTRYTWAQTDLNNGLLHDLTPFFEEPNPYFGDHLSWLDTFSPTITGELRHPTTGRLGGVALSTVAVRVYYNVDLFNELGLDVPRSWPEFIEVQAAIQDAGVIPIAFANSRPQDNHFLWSSNMMLNMIGAEAVEEFDFDSNDQLAVNEIVAAVDQGAVDLTSESWNGFFNVIKDWSEFWAPGANGLTESDAIDMFLLGDAAMVLGGSWHIPRMQDTSFREFDFGTFPLPYLTENEHPNASRQHHELGGYPDTVFSIPSTVTGERFEAALDFLHFLSSAEVANILGTELSFATTLVDVELPDSLRGFSLAGPRILMNIWAAHFDQQLNQELVQQGQLFIEGRLSLEQYTSQLQRTLETAVANYMRDNNWNAENMYGADAES